MRQRPFFPPLIALFPVLSVFSANVSLLPLNSIWRPMAVAVAWALILWGLLWLPLRDAVKSAVAASVLTLCCFGYAAFTKLTGLNQHGWLPITAWSLVSLGLAFLLAWKWKAMRATNFFAVALVVAASAQVTMAYWRASGTVELPSEVAGAPAGTAPDIFYIVLDGYGRSDALKRTMGFSDADFIDGLERRGFYVADKSRSNYCQTELSIASSLNLDFIQSLLPTVSTSSEDRMPLDRLLNSSKLVADLKSRGYRFMAITTDFPAIDFHNADVKLKLENGLSLLESTLLQMTPLVAGSGLSGSQFDERREVLGTAFRSLASLGPRTGAPRLVIAHILAPHPPFVFGPDGERVSHRGLYGFWDGSDFMRTNGTKQDYRAGYVGQAQWVGKQVLATLDALLAQQKSPPIVVIQGDHGSKLNLDQESLERTDVTECFPILNAYLVPKAVRHELYPEITPVNSWRTICRVLFSEALPNLPDRSWYSKFGTPYDFTDVTNRIEPPSE